MSDSAAAAARFKSGSSDLRKDCCPNGGGASGAGRAAGDGAPAGLCNGQVAGLCTLLILHRPAD
jgi:hypothetical protein